MSAEQTAPEAGGAAAAAGELSLLDQMLSSARVKAAEEPTRQRFVGALEQFVQQAMAADQAVGKDVEATIKSWIAAIDRKLSDQLNEIMHHPAYQKLEGTWRGLHYLVHQSETGESLQIRVLNATKDEVRKDLEKAVEFDQSETFKHIYESEYGVLGGTPYGMLVGDYEYDCKRATDVQMLQNMSGVAAAAHAPFISSVSPEAFNLERYADLAKPRDLAKIFSTVDYAPWKSFRESEDSRYVALTMPRVLARLPYGQKFVQCEAFNFEEDVDGTNHDKYQWMSSAWAYASRITSAFSNYGWLARTRGVEGGGKVEGLPVHTFPTDDGDVAMKCPTEVAITDRREAELSELGFLPLVHCKGKDYAAFMGAQSCQKAKKYFEADATANAALSAKINLIMCVSRFAHFLKVMVRDRIGSFMERDEMERWLNRWINNYTVVPDSASDETKAKQPLSWAEVKVESVPGQPGVYRAVALMRPHFQLEGADISLRLVAKQQGGG